MRQSYFVLAALLAATLAACTPSGGRDDSLNARHELVAAEVGERLALPEPVGGVLQSLGLGYRVDTLFAQDAELAQVFYGVAGVPLLLDVDANLATGLAGADIQVDLRVFGGAYQLEVRRLGDPAVGLPLRLEARFADPLQRLGGSQAELRLGFDARQESAPELFRSSLSIASLGDLLPLAPQLASLQIDVAEGPRRLTVLGGANDLLDGELQSVLDVALQMTPPAPTTRFDAAFGATLNGGEFAMFCSAPSRLDIRVDNLAEDGLVSQDLSLDQVDGEVSLRLSEDEASRLAFNAEKPVAWVGWQRNGRDQVAASLQPLPHQLDACFGDGDSCGSHGGGTDASFSLAASESLLLNYRRESGGRLTLVEDLELQYLAVDFGSSSSMRKGYLFMDTDGAPLSGRVLQDRGRQGFDLRFGAGTWAQDRRVTWKNYLQIDRRDGQMKCPGGASLDLKIDGRFHDADFVVDQLCQ